MSTETMLVDKIQRAEQRVDADMSRMKVYDTEINGLDRKIAEVRKEYEKKLKELLRQFDQLTDARERCARSMMNHMAELEEAKREVAFGTSKES